MSCSTEDNLAYYSLEALQSDTDYVVKSPLSAHEFTLNICQPVRSQLWNVLHLAEDQVGGFYRGQHGDFAIGSTNSTLSAIDGNPVLYMNNGSPCPNAGDSNMLANTAVRFICDSSMFGAGEPQLIAQFPADDEHACSFYFEWRTQHACPSGRKPAGVLHLLILFASFLIIALFVYLLCVTLYNRFSLGLRGWDQFPSMPCFSPLRLFATLHDKITGRGDGFVGGPGVGFGSSSNGSSSRWGGRGASRWRWGKWGRQSHSNGYGRIPEEEQGILDNDRGSFEDAEEDTPRVNGITSFDNAWAGARSGGGIDSDGVIRL